jgi:hypothetical protein
LLIEGSMVDDHSSSTGIRKLRQILTGQAYIRSESLAKDVTKRWNESDKSLEVAKELLSKVRVFASTYNW